MRADMTKPAEPLAADPRRVPCGKARSWEYRAPFDAVGLGAEHVRHFMR